MSHVHRPGDELVIERDIYAMRPIRDAISIQPSRGGETYQCRIRERVRVVEIAAAGRLLVQAEDGDRFMLAEDDPAIHRPSIVSRWRAWFESFVTHGAR